jgi:hypothetical protein
MVAYPRLLPVKQNFPDRRIADIPAEVQKRLSTADFASRARPGARVAIGVGSRGIANIAVIVKAVVDYWKAAGARPFLFPAMGSHGAATAEGQADVLAHYGIVEATMGCPVVSQLEVASLGKTPEGIPVFVDRTAFESDGIMLVGRVKWHTDFAGKIESGLFKMMAIGLGKFAGARTYHSFAYRLGLEHVVRSVGRQVIQSGKILGGLAILEDANHNTAKLDAVPADVMEKREEENLALVKSWMGKIPVPELDLLILDEMGKNISGAGLDSKVANRGINGEYNPWPATVIVHRLFVRELSELSYHNAVGIGMADITTDRLVASIDWTPTHINALTSNPVASVRTPIHFPTDEECLRRIWPTVGKFSPGELTIGWFRNTMELNLFALSENLLPVIESNAALEIVGEPANLEFDESGNLTDFRKLLLSGMELKI